MAQSFLLIPAVCGTIILFGQHIAYIPLRAANPVRDRNRVLTLLPKTSDLPTSILVASWNINHAATKAFAENPRGLYA